MNVRNRFVWVWAPAAGLLATLIAGCATQEPRPTAEMSQASTLIQQAEASGAQQQAGTELAQARDKLRLAETAADRLRRAWATLTTAAPVP